MLPQYMFFLAKYLKSLQDIKNVWFAISRTAGLHNDCMICVTLMQFHLVSSGLSLSFVGKLLSHTQAVTTQRHAHLADETLRQAAELFKSKVEQLTKSRQS